MPLKSCRIKVSLASLWLRPKYLAGTKLQTPTQLLGIKAAQGVDKYHLY